MRSSCVRLDSKRGRGPKSLKIIEITSQLNQYQTLLGWNWRENVGDLPNFVEKSLELLNIYESRTSSLIGFPDVQC